MYCYYRSATSYGGEYAEMDVFPVWTEARVRGKKRRAKCKPSSEVQEKYNQKCRERKLVRLIHANFTEADYAVGLDYCDEELPEEDDRIKKDARNYLARLKRLYAKRGVELKYILVSAHGKRGGRAHHHLIVSGGVDEAEIRALWRGGRCRCEPLQFDRDGVADLADYILRQSEVWSKHWCASRNVVLPEPVIDDDKISAREAYALANRETSPLEMYRIAGEIMPGYELASVQSQNLNDLNGGAYCTLRFIRKGAKYASCDYEHWATAWEKRQRKADKREVIEIADGRSSQRRRELPGTKKMKTVVEKTAKGELHD